MQSLRRFARVIITSFLVTAFAAQPSLSAQTHVVSPTELRRQAVAATRARQHNLATVTAFLSSPKAGNALRSARIAPAQVTTAIPTLSDQELAQLTLRAEKAQADFAAGDLTERDLLLILVGLAALILVIVAVR